MTGVSEVESKFPNAMQEFPMDTVVLLCTEEVTVDLDDSQQK